MTIVIQISTQDKEIMEYPVLEKCTIGRSHRCDLVIDDLQISGKHGSLQFDKNDKIFYTDLESTNGSFLNNIRINEAQFKINDVLQIGNTVIVINEKKLTTHERKAIGSTKVIKKKPKPPEKNSPSTTRKDINFSDLSKSIVIKESLKERILNANSSLNEQKKLSERYNDLSCVDRLELEINTKQKKKK